MRMSNTKVHTSLPVLAALALFLCSGALASAPPSTSWDLTAIFADTVAWEREYDDLVDEVGGYEALEGTLGRSGAALLAALAFDADLRGRLDRLELHAKLARDLDLESPDRQDRWERVTALVRRVTAARSFLRPEIMALGEERLDAFLAAEPGLRSWEIHLRRLLADREHALSADEEKLLAMAEPLAAAPGGLFFTLTQNDLEYPTIAGEDGEDVQITPARFEAARTSLDRDYRARAYTAFFQAFADREHTLAALYGAQTQATIFMARARGHDSALAASLAEHDIPVAVYHNLVEAVGDNLAPLHRWTALKKDLLGLDRFHDHDNSVTLFPADKQEYSFERACELVLAAVRPLGEQYVADLERALVEGWVDPHESEGKSQGAYCSGPTDGTHPYVLMAWQGQVTDLFTLAHELGHLMHAYYTVEAQPYQYADYATFAAEVASITNELLLAHHLIDSAETPRERLVQIEQEINNVKLLYYWATLLADFELQVYEAAESGESLTPTRLCATMGDLFAKYYGPSLEVIEADTYLWGALRHVFYADFYLYQYATSMSAAQQIVADILSDPDAAVRYRAFLRTGSSCSPLEALRRAGVDMTTPRPMLAVSERMDALIDEFEELAATAAP
jgi:oligoendopeptidase F